MRFTILITLFILSVSGFSQPSEDFPKGFIKKDDLVRAHENIKRHEWAQQYLHQLTQKVDRWLPQITPEFLEQFIPDTTPGDRLFTPCPACRDQGKDYLPQGNWEWMPDQPDVLRCRQCTTVFPHEQYPETVEVRTTWGRPQVFTFMGGEPFPVFSYPTGRLSLSGNIRAQKVVWVSILVRDLAEAYALTQDEKYATGVKAILLRFAEVYPWWLVHVGYGEYADMEPAVAAENILALPKEETVYPPNKPDRRLHTGYWSAGRAHGEGMEGIFVRRVATAYDLTYAVYKENERSRIESDLLRESTFLLLGDKGINNKSMGNRSAAGVVGILINDPELVRFGMEGFFKTVNEWFLPDGSTPESPAYANMALGGIVEFAQALRGYTDPPGYKDAEGKRYDNFAPYRDPQFQKVWEGIFLTLQGDLHYPPFADSYKRTGISKWFAELMADNYPENDQFLALLYAALGRNWSNAYAPVALYYADPERTSKSVPDLQLPSHLFPSLKLGFMRTGTNGRESLLLLSASDWGGHHHLDGLNLYYWKNGQELWSDLGYLWDHPDKKKTSRTLAHHTVMLDEQDQIASKRVGKVRYFLDTKNVKAMRATVNAYANAEIYERAVTLVDHGEGRNYVVDVFWVKGGTTQDYIYHGPANHWEPVNAELKKWEGTLADLTNLQSVEHPEKEVYGLKWKMPEAREFMVWHIPIENEQVLTGDGWGQRDSKNSDRGATLPYIVRRVKSDSEATSVFVSVMEEFPAGNPYIKTITPLKTDSVIVLQIDTLEGRDYVALNFTAEKLKIPTPDGVMDVQTQLTVQSKKNGELIFYAVENDRVAKDF